MPKSKLYCFKTYFKHRAWKQIVQWFLIGAVSVGFLGTFAVCDAYAAAVTQDIEGVTVTVGDPDEGTLDFNSTDGDYEQYAARLYFSGDYESGDPDDFELRGWVWNEQFGWISLYCGSDGRNLGVPCGNIEYGVKVDLSNEGRMYGWAWGDNIGWLSFDCQGTKNENLSCGSTEYGSYLNIVVAKGLGEVDAQNLAREPMAWSDTVGKFDLNGIGSSILDLMVQPGTEEADYGIWTKVENKGATDPDAIPTKDTMPVADGTESYTLYVHVADILGNSINHPSITYDLDLEWLDTVQLNQTVDDQSAGNLGAVDRPDTLNPGQVRKFDFTSGGVLHSWYYEVKSIAPTDEGNCYDPDNDGCDFYYKEFAEDEIADQTLEYLGGSLTLTVPTVGSVTIDPVPFVTNNIRTLEFAPAVEVNELSFLLPGNPPKPINVIQSTRNTVDTFEIGAVKRGNPGAEEITLELSSLEDDVDYNFIFSIDDSPLDGSNILNLTVQDINNFIDGKFYAIPFTPSPESADDLLNMIAGAELKTTVNIPGKGLVYYSNGLPRTDDSEIINQTVEILSGSVFSPGAIKASSEADVELYGDVAVYEARDQINRDVSNLTKGVSVPNIGTITINDATSLSALEPHMLKNGRVYYFEDTDVELESIEQLKGHSNNEPISIILRGGDLYIDGNINDSGNEVPVGLIVLESSTDSAEDTKGGHIYVNSLVTDMVEVSIFADGPMFRYVPGICYNTTDGLREPNFVDSSYGCGYEEPVSSLNNQFYLRGNVATMNCIGCSVSSEPTRGDGTKIAGGATPKNFSIARLYDFHYFTYFRLHPETGDRSGALSTMVPASATANRPVYFEYSPAPSKMFGFRSL